MDGRIGMKHHMSHGEGEQIGGEGLEEGGDVFGVHEGEGGRE